MHTLDTYQLDPRWRVTHHGAGAWAVEHRAPRARRWQFICWAPAGDTGSPEWLTAAYRSGAVYLAGRRPEVSRAVARALQGRQIAITLLPVVSATAAVAWLDGARGQDLDDVVDAFVKKHQ